MQDGELQKSAGTQHAGDLAQHPALVRHVHQRHEGGGEIEARIGEGNVHAVAELEGDAERILRLDFLRMADEGRRDVDRLHPGAAPGELTRIGTFAAGDIETGEAVDIRQHRQKSRRVQGIAIDVVAGAGMTGPGFGIGFPMFRKRPLRSIFTSSFSRGGAM